MQPVGGLVRSVREKASSTRANRTTPPTGVECLSLWASSCVAPFHLTCCAGNLGSFRVEFVPDFNGLWRKIHPSIEFGRLALSPTPPHSPSESRSHVDSQSAARTGAVDLRGGTPPPITRVHAAAD